MLVTSKIKEEPGFFSLVSSFTKDLFKDEVYVHKAVCSLQIELLTQ